MYFFLPENPTDHDPVSEEAFAGGVTVFFILIVLGIIILCAAVLVTIWKKLIKK